MKLAFLEMASPVGTLKLVAHETALVAVLWENENPKRVRSAELIKQIDHPILLETQKQLTEYFAGKRQQFDVPLDFEGTEFQKKVWQALLSIPFGETRSYRDIAEQIGNVKAVRAVGAANGKNPISIIAPCHRVIGMNGKLVGFAGGLGNKDILLKLSRLNKSKTIIKIYKLNDLKSSGEYFGSNFFTVHIYALVVAFIFYCCGIIQNF